MGRGLISGLIWGALLAIVAVALLSLGAPLPDRPSPATPVVTAAPETAPPPPSANTDDGSMTGATGAVTQAPPPTEAASPTETAQGASTPSEPERTATGPASEIPLPAGSEFNRPPEERDPALPGIDTAPAAPPQVVTQVPSPVASPMPNTSSAPQPTATAAVEAPQAMPSPETDDTVTGPGNSAPLPPLAEDQPTPLGLPQIEADPAAETASAPQGRPLQPITDPLTEADPEGPARAIDLYAAPFDAAETRPLMAVILIDDESFPLGRDVLTRFDFPVTFAIDPRRPDAAEAAQAYRAAGFEVVMMADVLLEETTPDEVPDLLHGGFDMVPEAVAVLDTPAQAIQGRRDVLETVVEDLASSGHGLVAYPRGLNMAEQAAGRAGVPAATLFREIDGDRERATVITRYLDRAAFAAAQEGTAIVVGHTYSDTVTALFSWALGTRSSEVALAPLSAVLTR
ncbi:divergent polysaccharide deacetylase family protein [Nioella nitratireducens]|uniref:divergent polysaccharide deacetylase family protein n=1 Tax=Nioella nitratireducens TaxID=1287720 RepID=UPI0008FD8803|nr:divergent polysaccharide deacetylase family protein [Nioella nitratireducens]